MQLIPSIDLKAGKCVRLYQGDMDHATIYPDSPREVLARYESDGARWVHVVDLDGAVFDSTENREAIADMVKHSRVNIQLGGGIRRRERIEKWLGVGVSRVVIGSAAIDAPEKTADWLRVFGPEKVVLAFDVRRDSTATPQVMTHGWTETSQWSLWQALEHYAGAGLSHVLCTDIDRDGTLQGANIDLYRCCVQRFPEFEFQASGGVRDLQDLVELRKTGVASVIAGRSLLDGRITTEEYKPFLRRE